MIISRSPVTIQNGSEIDVYLLVLRLFINQFEDPEENAILYRLTATQLWAQIHFGTFRRESPQAATLSEILDRYADPARARELFQLLEHKD